MAMDQTERRLAALRAVTDLITASRSGSAPPITRLLSPGQALSEAVLVDEFLRTGKAPHRPLSVRLSRAGEVVRPSQQGSGPMPAELHRGRRYEWDPSVSDAITGAAEGWDQVTTATEVQPPEAGTLTLDTERNKLVFDPAPGAGPTNFSVSLVVTPNDGGAPVTATDSGVIDPDGIVVGLSGGAEVDRPTS